MTRTELANRYFDWMCQLVTDDQHSSRSYQRLLMRLHETEFVSAIPMDDNRAVDGMDLRYRFGDECSFPAPMIASLLDDSPCSVLEMMVALAVRCEEHIMDDPDIGDRTGKWFWGMIRNLRLESMSDFRFDRRYVDDILVRLLERRYERNGEGGLFTVNNGRDMRQIDIWYQMNYYLDEIV